MGGSRHWSGRRGLALLVAALLSGVARGAVTVELRPGLPAAAGAKAPALWAALPDADRQPGRLQLLPAKPFEWVYEPGAPVSLTAVGTAPEQRAVLTIWDWQRTPVAWHGFTTPFRETVNLPVIGRGTWLLTLDLCRGDECVLRLARSLSICPSNRARQDTWRDSEFQPGCCAFPGRQHWRNDFGPAHPPDLTEAASRQLDAELSTRLGLVLVRPDLPASQRSPEQPIDFARADESLRCWTSRGFRLALQIGFADAGDWALLPHYRPVKDPKWRYPRTEQVTREFAAAAAARYGRDAAFIELYNEPDNLDFWRGTADEFIAAHHQMAAGARRGAPGVPLISGGLCLMDPERTGLIARGIRDQVDGVGYHSHGGVDALEASLTAMRAAHAAAGYRAPVFYNTEMGFANWRLDMERSAAATAVQKLLYCWAHGNRAGLVYCSRDIGGPRSSGDWGYLDYWFCPRFTYGALAAFLDTYAGARREAILRERDGLYAYCFRQGERRLVPLFVGHDYPRPVQLLTDATAAAIVDPMGNVTPANLTGGRLALTAGYYPSTVVLTGAQRVELAN